VAGGFKMFGHVGIGRTVAAKRDAAGLAGTQMYPTAVGFNALRAEVFLCVFYFRNCLQVLANIVFHNDVFITGKNKVSSN
jgi:hypothetical protein